MASGIFTILDDIASLMDDVAVASKVATKKTAGILGDDLTVNANKAMGFVASREIPVLWEITKGSLLNKAIIVPIALIINIFFPLAIEWILVLGGLYLAFEGVEKIIHKLFYKKENNTHNENITETPESEKDKIKSAISTDFILSLEIVIIALGEVLNEALLTQILSVSIVSLIATFGVYGTVALIVRMDDLGYAIIRKSKGNNCLTAQFGNLLVKVLPIIIRILSVVGTIALILVAGGIFAHHIPPIHHLLDSHFHSIPEIISEFVLGILGGFVGFIIMELIHKILPKKH